MTALQTILDIVLAAVALTFAVWSIVARGAFTSVLSYVAYGITLSLVWVRLFATDVALTEAAIGGGVTGLLLINAAASVDDAADMGREPGRGTRLLAGIVSLGTAIVLAAAVLLLPDPAPTLAPSAVEHLPATGVGNPVTAVLIAYRAFDTMLEKVVLILAVIGVWSLAPDRLWGGAPGEARLSNQSGPLVFLARVLVPIGIVVGIHIFWVGADAPGGAFQGGAILAAMWMIAIIARLTDLPSISSNRLRLCLVAGPLVFLIVGLLGFAWSGAFLAYPAGIEKPVILFIEAFMVLSIAATLPLLVAGPPARSRAP